MKTHDKYLKAIEYQEEAISKKYSNLEILVNANYPKPE